MDEELVPRKVNTLILRVDFRYQYKSHPELRDSGALTEADVKKLVAAAKKDNIRMIPQINLLGHQSWAGKVNKLLQKYPEFDETPYVKMPAKLCLAQPGRIVLQELLPAASGSSQGGIRPGG